MRIKILKIENVPTSSYVNKDDAGLDIYSAEELVLKSNERKAVRTGMKMEIPAGCVGLIWDKSGLALNNGIKTMAGVVDSGYRGEIKVVLANLSKEDFLIRKKSKIAQMIIQKFERAKIEVVEELSESERGDRGFGSSGLD